MDSLRVVTGGTRLRPPFSERHSCMITGGYTLGGYSCGHIGWAQVELREVKREVWVRVRPMPGCCRRTRRTGTAPPPRWRCPSPRALAHNNPNTLSTACETLGYYVRCHPIEVARNYLPTRDCQVINRVLDPRCLSAMASFDMCGRNELPGSATSTHPSTTTY